MTRIAVLALREASRAFSRQKSMFAIAVLTLALGLGLTTAMFCVLYGAMLRPLSYGDPQHLMLAWAGYTGSSSERDSFGEQAVVEWQQSGRAFEGVAGFRYRVYTLLQRGEPANIEGAQVSPEFFSTFVIKPVVGTVFGAERAKAEQGRIAVISHGLWMQRFAASPMVAGQTINLGGDLYTIAGVAPADFGVPSSNTDVWIPLPVTPAAMQRARTLMVGARIKPGVTFEQAQADANIVAGNLARAYPDSYRGMRIHLVPFLDELVKDARQFVLIGCAIALLTLLICCANVANLLLVRAIARRAEFATRLAIGAARRHLLAVVFSESLLLVLCGGLLGAVLARWMIAALAYLAPGQVPRAVEVGTGLQIPTIAALAMLVAVILVTLPAAWEIGRAKLSSYNSLGARTTSRRFAGQLIVALEIAVALTLVAGSGLMARTILALRDTNPGWKSDHLLVTTIALPGKAYPQPHQMRQFFQTLIERLRATPGVVAVAASSSVPVTPIGADFDVPIRVLGAPPSTGEGQAAVRIVSPELFKTLGIPILQGRDLDAGDGNPQVARVVVNQAFARKHLPESPAVLGRQVEIQLGAPRTYEIVGVVGDVHHYGILQDAKPEFYISFEHRPFVGMGVIVRTTGDPAAFAPLLLKELWNIDPTLAVASSATMESMVTDTWKDRTTLTVLMLAFTGVVIVLTIVGVFSVVSFSVSRQVREIAIHMALGARNDDVVRLVMRQSALAVGLGLAAGGIGAWVLGRGLTSLLYGVAAGDPRVLVFGAAGVLLVAALGAYLPSRRAARIDPVVALRIS